MNRSGDGDVGDEIARSLLAHSVNLTSSKACGKGRIIRQNLDMDCGAAGTEDDRLLENLPDHVDNDFAGAVHAESRIFPVWPNIFGTLEMSPNIDQ